jgi:hypothetical protein
LSLFERGVGIDEHGTEHRRRERKIASRAGTRWP